MVPAKKNAGCSNTARQLYQKFLADPIEEKAITAMGGCSKKFLWFQQSHIMVVAKIYGKN